jgi:hypothetical protein
MIGSSVTDTATPRSGLTVHFPDPLRHPEFSDFVDDERDVVMGGAQERLGCASLARRSEHGPPEWINTIEQDRQQQAVLDAVQITQRLPCLEAQPHRGEEAHAPWLWQHRAVIRFLEDRRVLLGCDRQAFTDCIEASGNCLDHGERVAGCGPNVAVLAE